MKTGEHRVHGQVFACLIKGELRISILPKHGMAGDAHVDVPMDMVPPESRLPNSLVWVTFSPKFASVLNVEARDQDVLSPMS